jgi:hypothetical protein
VLLVALREGAGGPFARAGLPDVRLEGLARDAALARDIEQASTLSFSLVCLARVEAAQGKEADCRTHVGEALQLTAFGIGSVIGYAESTLGLLDVGLDRPREAIGPLEQLSDQTSRHRLSEPGVIQWAPI